MQRVPYAVSRYEQIVDDGYYFVDKTRFIRELERYTIPVFLRPRRFGKSLWCSILECYYDVNRKDRFDELFGSTDIGRNPTPLRNSHLVLRLDFSVVEVGSTFAEIEADFNRAMNAAFRVFVAKNRPIGDFSTVIGTKSASDGLREILTTVQAEGLPPLNIIIDEYDNFTNQLLTMHRDDLYREVTTGDSFLRTFFKIIKAGVGAGTVARCFITGVLPITIDDLTSGFNISQIITLQEHTLNMMGFTQDEMDAYVDEIFADRGWSSELRARVGEDLRGWYNGYRLLPDAKERLYNSTICNYYLNNLVIGEGVLPREMIDPNLRTDINWLRRLAGGTEGARDLVDQLLLDGGLSVDLDALSSTFSMTQFFDRRFFPLSLYYLGMVTFVDRFRLAFPNLTMAKIFIEYFNDLWNVLAPDGYESVFRSFLEYPDWAKLFAGYWERYVGRIPAQAFDKANENFFRTTFFELCSRYLSPELRFMIEVNVPTGRCDFFAIGREGTTFSGRGCVIEFKHYSKEAGRSAGLSTLERPLPDHVRQVTGYADSFRETHPGLTIEAWVAYTSVEFGGRLLPAG